MFSKHCYIKVWEVSKDSSVLISKKSFTVWVLKIIFLVITFKTWFGHYLVSMLKSFSNVFIHNMSCQNSMNKKTKGGVLNICSHWCGSPIFTGMAISNSEGEESAVVGSAMMVWRWLTEVQRWLQVKGDVGRGGYESKMNYIWEIKP